jgi:hypothetical protein
MFFKKCSCNSGLYGMDHISDHAPDREFGSGDIYVDRGEARRFGNEPDLVKGLFQSSDQHFAIQGGDDHLAVGGFCRAVDDDDIPVGNAGADHGIAVYPHEEGVRSIYTEELFDFHDKMFEGKVTRSSR